MSTANKIVAMIGALIFGGGLYYYFAHHSVNTINLKMAQQEFDRTHDQALFDKRKSLIEQQYLSGSYEAEIAKVCANATRHFSAIPVDHNSAVLFDVDDTALYNWHPMGDFIWQQPKYVSLGWPKIKPAIKPVLDLYKKLQALGFKIIFLTSRSDNDYENTKRELESTGYTHFEKLILMPTKLAFDSNIKTADWKLSVRKELSKEYEIVGSIGDRDADFEGGYSGALIKLPNYLY